MVMQKLLGILSVCLRRKGVWVSKILKCGTGAAMVKHLWSSCNPAKSIWSSWISFYLLHGRSFWEIPWSGNCSWSKRKILGFRGVVRKFIYFWCESCDHVVMQPTTQDWDLIPKSQNRSDRQHNRNLPQGINTIGMSRMTPWNQLIFDKLDSIRSRIEECKNYSHIKTEKFRSNIRQWHLKFWLNEFK
jgi:hypothetical protein